MMLLILYQFILCKTFPPRSASETPTRVAKTSQTKYYQGWAGVGTQPPLWDDPPPLLHLHR